MLEGEKGIRSKSKMGIAVSDVYDRALSPLLISLRAEFMKTAAAIFHSPEMLYRYTTFLLPTPPIVPTTTVVLFGAG